MFIINALMGKVDTTSVYLIASPKRLHNEYRIDFHLIEISFCRAGNPKSCFRS